jgi:hypothetical protein
MSLRNKQPEVADSFGESPKTSANGGRAYAELRIVRGAAGRVNGFEIEPDASGLNPRDWLEDILTVAVVLIRELLRLNKFRCGQGRHLIARAGRATILILAGAGSVRKAGEKFSVFTCGS